MVITLRMLQKAKACKPHQELFALHFPRGMRVTKKNCRKAFVELAFSPIFASKAFLTEEQGREEDKIWERENSSEKHEERRDANLPHKSFWEISAYSIWRTVANTENRKRKERKERKENDSKDS